MPLTYLNDPDLVQSLESAIELAEMIHKNLDDSSRTLARGLATKEDAGKVAESFGADELYWSRLDAPFRKLLVNLPNNNPGDEREWAGVLEKAAEGALAKIINGLDGSGKSLRAATEAETEFSQSMRKIRKKFPNYFPQAQTKGGKQ